MNVVVGITGASGACYGRRLVEVLLQGGHDCQLIVSPAGEAVIGHELNDGPDDWAAGHPQGDRLIRWGFGDLFAPFCSGSSRADGMVVVPCSMGTLGRISAGTADSLLTRAADVCLKERVPLILAVRETPLNLIHIENMARVARAGAIILPASPGFYHRPSSLQGIVDHVVGKILDCLNVENELFERWNKKI